MQLQATEARATVRRGGTLSESNNASQRNESAPGDGDSDMCTLNMQIRIIARVMPSRCERIGEQANGQGTDQETAFSERKNRRREPAR